MGHKAGCHCECPEARVERFIQPCILLLLAESPSHGYDLMERLQRFGFEDGADPGAVYRNLRRLEEEGFVSSSWETAGSGPARRSYTLTDDGFDLLQAWVVRLHAHSKHINDFLKGYDALSIKGGRE